MGRRRAPAELELRLSLNPGSREAWGGRTSERRAAEPGLSCPRVIIEERSRNAKQVFRLWALIGGWARVGPSRGATAREPSPRVSTPLEPPAAETFRTALDEAWNCLARVFEDGFAPAVLGLRLGGWLLS